MKKNLITVSIISTIVAGIMYLSFSFVRWEPNPFLWGESTRSGFIILSLFAIVMIFFIILSITSDNDYHQSKF